MTVLDFLGDVSRWPRRRRYLVAVWFGTTIVLGTVGYFIYENQDSSHVSLFTALYHTAQLFILHAPHFDKPVNWMLEVARWSAAAFTAGTVYHVARHLLRDEIRGWRMDRRSGHLIVAGLGRRGLECARYERRKAKDERRNVVVIDRAPPDDFAERCAEIGADLLTGDACEPDVLRRAGIERASELYALCPDDSVNCEAAVQAANIVTSRSDKDPLRLNVHLSDVDLRVALQHSAAEASPTGITLRFFDLFDLEARRVLLHALPMDHDGITVGDTRRAHLIIVGFGRMGRTLAVRAAKLGHFANVTRDPMLRLKISVIDRRAAVHREALLFRYPRFEEVCDLSVHSLDIESPEARDVVERGCADESCVTSLAVCFDNEARALEVALRFLPWLEVHAVPVAVRVARRTGLASVMERALRASRRHVHPFGMLEEGWPDEAFADTLAEQLARAIHEDFRARRIHEGRDPHTEVSLAPWDDLTEDLRESNRQQADHLFIKLRGIGRVVTRTTDDHPTVDPLDDEEIEILARMEHARWNAERWLAGWHYDPAPTNVELRTSPYLVPWSELPADVQDYDRVAVELIPELLTGAGMSARKHAGREYEGRAEDIEARADR